MKNIPPSITHRGSASSLSRGLQDVPLFDAYAPAQIALRVRDVGVAKATAPLLTTIGLAVLAGAFISLGAVLFTVTMTVAAGAVPIAYGPMGLLGGLAFSLGLVLVVIAGAELFTGNNLIAMAWASGRIRTTQLLSNWFWVYLGNLIGALGTVLLVWLAGIQDLGLAAVGERAVRIAYAKVLLDPTQAFFRGILCNVLVCLAVWLCMGARSVTDKILAIVFPISAFVACGFEHSIANMYFIPAGFMLTWAMPDSLPLVPALVNLLLVTLGNVLGGTVLVALVYWFVYLRESSETREARTPRVGLFRLFRSS